MINKNQFSDAMSGLDVETVERYLRAEQSCLVSKAKRRRTRTFTALVAAVLALAMLASFAIIPFIPKTYDLNYEFPKHQFANTNTKVFFVTEDGEIQSQRVKLPDTESNVFLTWKHLNTVGDEVQLLEYVVDVEEDAGTAVVPNNLWEFLVMKLNGSASDGYKTVTATLSPQITSYENYDALIESLIQTIAKYAGVSPEQVKILIDGEQVVIPGVSGRLQFSHSLMGGNAMAVVGGTLDITVTMTNISLENIEFTGSWGEFVPDAILTMGNTAVITHEDYAITEEYQKYTLAPGESREMTYRFAIPEGAVCGEYDLLVTFGDDSFTFEKAVQVVGFGYVYDASTPFAEFLTQYGFDTADTEKFKAAVRALSLDGIGLLDIMNQADVEWCEGYGGEIWSGDRFHYQCSIYSPLGVQLFCTNSFKAKVLPDGMTLPHGIAPEDTLAQALCKMGYTEQNAQQLLAAQKQVILSSNPLSSVATLFLTFGTTYIDIIYEYDGLSLTLKYDKDEQTFRELWIETRGLAELQVTFTSYEFMEYECSLSAQQCSTLAQMLSRARLVYDTVDLICDSTCLINGQGYSYDTNEGLFCGNGQTLTLTDQDRVTFNAMLRRQFTGDSDPDTTIEVNSPYDDFEHFAYLYNTECAQIMAILNSGEWQTGDAITRPYDCFDIIIHDSDGMHELCYDSEAGIFQYDDFYLRISQADMNTVNEIFGGYTVEMPQ